MTILDTLKLARRLRNAGFSEEQATGAAEALAELVFPDVATKADLKELETALRGEIGKLETELRGEIAEIRGEISGLRGEIAAVRGELHAEIGAMSTRIAQWIVGAMLVNVFSMVAAVTAVWQLAGRHP
ncbi:MAG: CCDC90 family protein [Acidobacteriia bacterium]|nr:hypothetical protein [Methyloceanibacter sp.]MBX5472950.1 hypothetical protein [Acetobacteraceae bacterium]MCL6492089.1 CCDC90 family protein [Terriglobia bacterium]